RSASLPSLAASVLKPNNFLSDTDVAIAHIAGYDAWYGDSMASHGHPLASQALALQTINPATHDPVPPEKGSIDQACEPVQGNGNVVGRQRGEAKQLPLSPR